MAVATVVASSLGRTGPLVIPSLMKLTVTPSSTGYLTAWGGLPFDLAAILNSIGPFSAPINPADVVDILPTFSTAGYIVKTLSFGRNALASDGTISLTTPTTFTSAATTFTAADTGYSISIPGAGPGGATLVAKMTYVSAHVVTLDTAASTAVTTALALIGCPTYTKGQVLGSVTRVDATARPQLTLATCPVCVRYYGVVTGTPGVATTELSDGASSDPFTAYFIVNRGGTNA